MVITELKNSLEQLSIRADDRHDSVKWGIFGQTRQLNAESVLVCYIFQILEKK